MQKICRSSAAHKIELLFLMSFTKCDTSTKHDAIVEVIGKNTSILRIMQCTNTGLSPVCCWGCTRLTDICIWILLVTDYNSRTKYDRNTKLQTHGEMNAHIMSHQLAVLYVFCTSESNSTWWPIIDNFLYVWNTFNLRSEIAIELVMGLSKLCVLLCHLT